MRKLLLLFFLTILPLMAIADSVKIGGIYYNLDADIVKMKWGGSWRMPTVDDFYELSDNCQIKWVSRSGAKGCLVTGPNGNSIFLPASGCVDEEAKKNFNEYGFYWTPCLIDSNTDYGKSFGGFLDEGGIGGVIGDRYAGYSIRPVIK